MAYPTKHDFAIRDNIPYNIGRFFPDHYTTVNNIRCYLTTIIVTVGSKSQFYRINWEMYLNNRKKNFSSYTIAELLQFYNPTSKVVLPPFHRWQPILNTYSLPQIWVAQYCYKV